MTSRGARFTSLYGTICSPKMIQNCGSRLTQPTPHRALLDRVLRPKRLSRHMFFDSFLAQPNGQTHTKVKTEFRICFAFPHPGTKFLVPKPRPITQIRLHDFGRRRPAARGPILAGTILSNIFKGDLKEKKPNFADRPAARDSGELEHP